VAGGAQADGAQLRAAPAPPVSERCAVGCAVRCAVGCLLVAGRLRVGGRRTAVGEETCTPADDDAWGLLSSFFDAAFTHLDVVPRQGESCLAVHTSYRPSILYL